MANSKLVELTNEYAKLVARENALKAVKAKMAEEIKAALKLAGASQFGTQKGLFTIYKTTTWLYSKAVQIKEEQLEKMKVEEKENGTAKPSFTEAMRFTSKKK